LRLLRVILAFIILSLPAVFHARHVHAQAQIGVELENVAALVSFGEQITFVATLKNPMPIRDASIVILDELQGVTHVEPLAVQADGRMEFRYDTRQNPLRPFTPLSWNYQFILPDGSSLHSYVFSTQYTDNRFTWESLNSGMLRIHWYGSSPDFGQAALKTAQAGLDSVNRLLPGDLTQPVDFYIYANLSDLHGTLPADSQEWIAGHADPALGVVTVAIEPGAGQDVSMQQRIPHELMHIMFYRAVGDGYRLIPVWLSEGMAGLAELTSNPAYDDSLQSAVVRSDWIPVNTLCGSFPAETDRAILAYAESQSFARYLYEAYGASGLLKLANTYASGADCETGPELAFSVSLSTLEKDWHGSLSGKNTLTPALHNITPYLVLLFIILLIPLIGIAGTMGRKGKSYEPESFFRK